MEFISQLASPHFFLAVFFGTLLFVFLRRKRKRKNVFYFPLGFWKKRIKLTRRTALGAGLITCVILLVLALIVSQAFASRQTVLQKYEKPVLLIFDVSGSMGGAGGATTGYTRALSFFKQTLKQDLNASIGIMLFSSAPYLARDFASDKALLRDTLENAGEVAMISQGTEMGDALKAARMHFAQEAADAKVIILVSDFEDPNYEKNALEIEKIVRSGITFFGVAVYPTIYTSTLQKFLSPKAARSVTFLDLDNKAALQRMFTNIKSLEGGFPVKTTRRGGTPAMPLLVFVGMLVAALLLTETKLRKFP